MREPDQYARFSDERSRPFFDLFNRIPNRDFRTVVDLGCGSGELTKILSARWAQARIEGLDSSPEMLARAKPYESDKLSFLTGDIGDYRTPADLLFSNAALHWLDDHESLFRQLASLVNSAGFLAVQMPSNFDQPSHKLMEESAFNGPWSEKLRDWKQLFVHPLRWYVDMLQELGFRVDAWETIYYFQLQGDDPVLEWIKGTSLQPIMSRLNDHEWDGFRSRYAAALRVAYPATRAGTFFPFKRVFFVAERS